MARAKQKDLSELEHRVMQVVWQSGACTADQVRLALAPDRELADSTVRTVLHRLEKKGYVEHTAEGRANVYRCRVAPGQAATRTVRRIIERFFDGSAESFLVGMVNERILSTEDLAEVAAKLAESAEGQRAKEK